jgi:uncharacterized membrane protein YiaA
MTSDSGLLTAVVAVAWFGAGLFGILTGLRHRPYVNSLPPTTGNLRLKRQNRAWLILGVAMLAIGAWNTYVNLVL